ncbi:MAG: peptidyl-prolyl cis-trans isomerase [Nitrospirae bacterium]|nr:peptidyl-prolyl cis-trans isomerase [Nitrospirota bacterium]
MNPKIITCTVSCLLIMFLAGCSKPVATVNGRAVDKKIFDALVKERVDEAKGQGPAADLKKIREAVVQELISEALMLEDAAKNGLTVTDAEVNTEVENVRKAMGEEAFVKKLGEKGLNPDIFRKRTKDKLLMSKFAGSLINGEAVTEEEIRRYYSESPRPLYKPFRVYMNMVEFASANDAAAAMDEIRQKNMDFDEMAKKLEAQKRATVSGYGWVNPEFFSPDIAHVVRNMKPGESGGPYKGRKDFYLLKIKEKEKETPASLDEMRDTIRNVLLDQKKQAAFAHWLDKRKKASKIEINLK